MTNSKSITETRLSDLTDGQKAWWRTLNPHEKQAYRKEVTAKFYPESRELAPIAVVIAASAWANWVD